MRWRRGGLRRFFDCGSYCFVIPEAAQPLSGTHAPRAAAASRPRLCGPAEWMDGSRTSAGALSGMTAQGMALLAAAGILIGPMTARAAEVVSPAPEAAALVIYPGQTYGPTSGLGLIVETRTVDLAAGPDVIRFRGVADTLVPQTAEVEGLPAPLTERDFDYDLLSPGSLLKRAVGGPVRLVRTERRTGVQTVTPAVVRSAPDGVVLQTAQGVEALGCSGAPEKLVFDALPAGLSDRPTLSARVVAPVAGRYTLTLRYLAGGFGWRANYVARVRPDGRTLDLNAWLTLQNQSGATIADAPVEVVAGRLALTGGDRPVEAPAVGTSPNCWNMESWADRMRFVGRPSHIQGVPFSSRMMAPPPPPPSPPMPDAALMEVVVTGAKVASQGELGDYKLYRLPEPTTVAARQTKQVAFIAPTPVPFETAYAYQVSVSGERLGSRDPATRIELVMQNKATRGLGKPLPAGSAAVSAPGPDGRPLLIGQASVQDTPVGLPWRLKLGPSHTVEVTPRLVEARRQGERRVALTLEAVLTNARAETVTVELRHAAQPGAWRVLSEDARHTVEAGVPQWTLRLAPGERRTFRWRMSQPG